ncbi:MAG: hypothetical protein R2867_34065 [Caldilineaceae bacterium]
MPWAVGIVLAIYVLLNFLFASGYYIIFELIWNGQTVGKRVAKLGGQGQRYAGRISENCRA